ncbi:hypothetical protein [Gordonia sp. FQ]|uniref:hypothetical protein n=1 Tax=Gordonia sp. FQ TaxID=3446634 RepID=UPI003F86C8A4
MTADEVNAAIGQFGDDPDDLTWADARRSGWPAPLGEEYPVKVTANGPNAHGYLDRIAQMLRDRFAVDVLPIEELDDELVVRSGFGGAGAGAAAPHAS